MCLIPCSSYNTAVTYFGVQHTHRRASRNSASRYSSRNGAINFCREGTGRDGTGDRQLGVCESYQNTIIGEVSAIGDFPMGSRLGQVKLITHTDNSVCSMRFPRTDRSSRGAATPRSRSRSELGSDNDRSTIFIGVLLCYGKGLRQIVFAQIGIS